MHHLLAHLVLYLYTWPCFPCALFSAYAFLSLYYLVEVGVGLCWYCMVGKNVIEKMNANTRLFVYIKFMHLGSRASCT